MAFPQRRQCLFVSTPLFPRRLVPAFQPSHQITPPRPILQPISLARKKFAKGESSPQRRSRRKTGADISRDREARARQSKHRRPLIAQWSGAVLAESTNYEFLDGRFFFPGNSVRWNFLESKGATKFLNPIGRAEIYDVVLRSQSARREGRVIARNREAAYVFQDGRGSWGVMKGYTCFCKGVDLFIKPQGFREGLLPGQVRKSGDLTGNEETVWEDLAVALGEQGDNSGDCQVDGTYE